MLRRIIIIAVIVLVPIAFYVASQYGELDDVTFTQASRTEATMEGDQAPKVIIVSSITQLSDAEMFCEDREGTRFKVDYTGSAPETPFAAGQVVRFVGHVHGGATGYFHATQVYAK
ncbi:MAG: hypothetical protein EHM43_01515 [Ignavibacteriae bacterium]|nr:MAG: hypothetical protein EHM43_01515 [Ignavibacteriota bacterium]